MNWDDTGYIIHKNRYNENSLIAEVFTKDHGKTSGIIFGGTSKKIKNYLQIGNKIFVNFNSKSENKAGYFKVEIQQALSPFYFDDQKKLLCITSAMGLIRLLTAESQKNNDIFFLIEDLYILLKCSNWIKEYIFWELKLLKTVGYDLNFEDNVNKQLIKDQFIHISKSQKDKKIVPNFLIDKNTNLENIKTLLLGLNIISDYLEKTILKPNNLSQPLSRLQFLNTLKQLV